MNSLETLQKLSASELRMELECRCKLEPVGYSSTKSLAMVARSPRPDLKDVASTDIVDEIKNRQKIIYGDDDRMDIALVQDQAVLANSRSVAAIFMLDDIVNLGNGRVSLPQKTFAESFEDRGRSLCGDEAFQGQPIGAICTAFLISEDIVCTAGHCLNSDNLHTRRFIFDYEVQSDGAAPQSITEENVFAGTQILGWDLDNDGADWAVVKLDRSVPNRTPLTIRKVDRVDDNQSIYVIGHPIGLPKKYAGNAEVRDNTDSDFFVGNLDTYGGNSGSPVFNAETHEVEGILVRGDQDFVSNGNCHTSLVCPVQGCRGEDCTRITLIVGSIA